MSLFPASFRQHRLLGGAMVLAATQLGASAAGLLRDRILYQTFPRLGVVDVYYAAFRPSDLLFQVGIMSAVGTVLMPLLANYRAKGNKEDIERLMNGTMGMGALLFGGLALVFALVLPWIAPYLVQFEGDQLRLYITFARLAFLTNFLFVFGNAAGQYLVTAQRYWIYGLTPIVYTIGTIAGTVFLTPSYGPLGPMIGTVAGGIVYVAWRLAGMYTAGIRPGLGLWHPDLHEMGILMLPRMLALGALQIQLLFFDAIASGLDAGSITINAAARNFESVLVGVAGIAIAQSAYPLMSASIAERDTKRFWIYVRKGVLLLLAITVPGAVALSLLAPVAAFLVDLRHVLPVFAGALALYAIAVPFESLNHLLLRAFYSMKNTLVPALASLCAGIFSVTLAWVLTPRIGVYSLAIGFVAGQAVQAISLGMLLPSRVRALSPASREGE